MGGMETYCWEFTRRLHPPDRPDLIVLPGRPDGSAPSMFALLSFGVATCFKLLVRRSAAVVHLGDLAIWPLGWIARLRNACSRVVISVHGSDVSFAERRGLRAALYRGYVRFGARCLGGAQLIANSEWIASLARAQGFRHVSVVPLATSLRAATEPSGHDHALFFAGRIMPSKGLGFIVRDVLPLLDPSLEIRVAGSVWSAEEFEVLQSPRVTFLGVLSPEALAREYQRALCVVVPSLAPEGFGLVAAEAASCGGVVIASDHSGLAEVIAQGVGLPARTGDAQDWAARITSIQTWSGDDRARFVSTSMAVAQRRYDWGRVVDETIALY